MSIASVMFIGSKSGLSTNARCAIFQEAATVPHLLVNHGIYYQAGDDPMFKKTDDYEHVILSSTLWNEREKVSDQQQPKQQPKQQLKQQPMQQPKRQPMQQPKRQPMQQPKQKQPKLASLFATAIGIEQPHASQDELQQQDSDKMDVPLLNNPVLPAIPRLENEPIHVPSIDDIADCKNLVNFISKDGNEVAFYNVFDFGTHHHMNELYKIFVRNLSLCAFVIDSSGGGINYEMIEKYRNFTPNGVIIVLKFDLKQSSSDKNKIIKLFEYFPNYLIQSQQSYVFSINPKESDQEVGPGILSHVLSEINIPKKFPFSWYIFGFKLRMFMISNHRSTVSVSKEAMVIAKKLRLNRPTVEAALEHLKENNIILYFKNDTVFLGVHMFSKIISKLCELHKSAIVNTSNLHEATAMYVSDHLDVGGYISLFIKLMILTPYNNGDDNGDENVDSNVQYLVPSLLAPLDENTLKKIRSDSYVPDLQPVYFKCPFIGNEFITMLTVFLLTHSKKWKLDLDYYQKPKCLHRNCVQFILKESSCIVTLSFFNGYIEVCAKFYGELVHVLNLNHIPTMIIQGLEKIKDILNSYQTFHFNMSFGCTCGRYDAIYNYESRFLTCENDSATASPSSSVYKWIGRPYFIRGGGYNYRCGVLGPYQIK